MRVGVTAVIARGARVALLLALAGFALGAPQGAAAAPTLPLSHATRWITDASGRVVIVHGINMVYKRAPYYPSATGFGAEDAEFLQSIGMNAVRVGVIWKGLEPEPGVFDEAYVERIEETVNTLAAHGIVSVIDMHQDMYNELFEGEGAPDWAVEDEGLENPHNGFNLNYSTNPALNASMNNFWANSPGPGGEGLQEYFADAWRYLAAHFKGNESVLGYEIWNEPWPGKEAGACLSPKGCHTFDATLSSFYERVAHAIREADPATAIYYEPNVLFDYGRPTYTKALGDPNAGFAFHDYCTARSPEGCESEKTVFKYALAHVKKTKEALLLTEFGSTSAEGDLDGMVAMADANMVPWLEWSFCRCEDPTGPTEDPLVINPEEPPTGANVGQLALHTLVEPYPQVIAGTPKAWRFERSSGSFTLSYLTKKASKGNFGAGAVAEVAAPATTYPDGYTASASGASVVSAPNAPVVELSADSGAKKISLSITPAS